MAKTEYQFKMPYDRIRELFNDSTCSEDKPTDGEFEEFMLYLEENPEEIIKGMTLNFWCIGGRM